MATARSLADGHIKLAICITKPANPALPTSTELSAAIAAECNILSSDFAWGATDSDKVAEAAVCDLNNVNALGASNFTTAMTIWRYFNSGTGIPDPTEDALFTACKVKGTNLWIYVRESGKLSTAAWATGDESYLGGLVVTDLPQPPSDSGGFVKRKIPLEPQSMAVNIVVG